MKKSILAVVAGLVAGWIITFVGELLSHSVYPPPTDIDFTDAEAMKAFIANLPTGAFLILLVVWALSAFGGGFIAGKIAPDRWQRVALITGVILLTGFVVNMVMIPQPMWVNIIGLLLYLPMAYVGGKLAAN